ncbi:hypothetical protein MUP77_18125 [Candidatus Bathyarchaeota archaeon]|nr:hypothetical protein [Candidatus Bathyarchaeota archaeon]
MNWPRENVELTEEFARKADLIDELAEDLRIEDQKGLQPLDLMEKAEEIKKKVEAARHLSSLLLSGVINPPTRYMLDIAKEVIAERYQVPILSDIEILAYTRKDERAKVSQMIRSLKESSVSLRARAHLREWIWRKIRAGRE